MNYDFTTRWLHLFVALFVVAQLVTGQLMDDEDEHDTAAAGIVSVTVAHEAHEGEAGEEEESAIMELHEAIGLAALAALAARLLWGFVGPAEASARRWFPWASRAGRAELIGDIRREVPMWLKGRLPEPSESDAIAKSVHGVMVLAALAAALAGFGMWLIGDHEHGLGHELAELHEVFANGVLLLVIGHVAMVIWHRLLGHRIAERIVPWARD